MVRIAIMSIGTEALKIYEELVELLPEGDKVRPDDGTLLEALHLLCLKHGTDKIQLVLDTLEASEDVSRRLVAAGFRRRLDSVTAVMGFKGDAAE